MHASIFHGLSAFPITPADEAGRVEEAGLILLLDRLNAAKVDSIGLLGSTGHYAYLSRAERLRAVEIATRSVEAGIPVIVGVGALRTDTAIDLARDAEKAGASGLLLAPVSYTPLGDEEVFQHFVAVAGATGLPLCIYNNPSTTNFSFSTDLISRLSAVKNIVALKQPAVPTAEMAAVLGPLGHAVPKDFAVGFSGDWNAAGALLAGGKAWYSVVGGLLPVPALALTRAAQLGDLNEVARIDGLLQPLWSLFKELSSFRVMYAGANHLGLTQAQPPRPILPLGKADQLRVADVLERLVL